MPPVADNFARCMQHVQREEGGYVNHPEDPGKATNFGITQATLDAARASTWSLPRSVQTLTWTHAQEVYRHHYWQPIRGDDLPFPYALMTLDAAIISGVPDAVRWLQMALRVKVDGWLGAKTLQAANTRIERPVLNEVMAQRMFHFMLQDSIDQAFGLGWARRLTRIYDAASQEIPR